MLCLMGGGLYSTGVSLEYYLKEFYRSIDEILNNYNYAIFIEDEDVLKKVFSVVEEIHKRANLKYYVITSIKIYLGESIIINCIKQYEHVNFVYFFSFNNLQETNTIYVLINFTLAELNTEERKKIRNDIEIVKKILKENSIAETREIPDGIVFSVPISAKVIEFFI